MHDLVCALKNHFDTKRVASLDAEHAILPEEMIFWRAVW